MIKDADALIKHSINLELKISELYALFDSLFPEDSEFWWQLRLEEVNHVLLFRFGGRVYKQLHELPQIFLTDSLRCLLNTYNNISALVDSYKKSPPSRSEAFNLAYRVENSASELHAQKFMEGDASNEIDDVFKELNKFDRDHADRIAAYMKENDVKLLSQLEI